MGSRTAAFFMQSARACAYYTIMSLVVRFEIEAMQMRLACANAQRNGWLVAVVGLACATAQRNGWLVADSAASSPDEYHRHMVGPYSMDPALDCAMRALCLEYGMHLGAAQPWGVRDPTASTIADALRLAADCNASMPVQNAGGGMSAWQPSATMIYADPVHGSDASGDGSIGNPYQSVERALVAARTAGPAGTTIVLRNGTFFLQDTITLTSSDSGLSIIAFAGETPVLSAGSNVSSAVQSWSPVPAPPGWNPNGTLSLPVQGSILAWHGGGCVDAPGATNPGVCRPLGQVATADACYSACKAAADCTGYTWHDQSAGAEWNTWCYARLDGYNGIDGSGGHWSGWYSKPTAPWNVWVAKLPTGFLSANSDQLYFNGRRAVRARWPNGNAETDLYPFNWASAASWLPPQSYPPPTETHVNNIRAYDPFFPSFQFGFNGTVANFTSGSFWGTRSPPAGSQYVVPSGLQLPANAPNTSTFTAVQGAVVHAMHGGLWGGWNFGVQSIEGTEVVFSRGGWQEARGSQNGAGFYLENLLQLLDTPGEWYADIDADQLYVYFNGTANATNPAAAELLVSRLHYAVVLEGTAQQPVTEVVLAGLTIAHTATDYLLPFTVPSGGDVSIHAGGAVHLNGTDSVTVANCTFFSIGGNALAVTGYNRRSQITGNEFAWIGGNAIVMSGLGGYQLAGSSDYSSFPANITVSGNLMREIAIYVKQAGGLYMSVSANITVRNNVIFNSARAGINVNDGFGGGHVISGNLMFNTVRETSDHGSVNSWDRLGYTWRSWNASAVDPLPMTVSGNMILTNYHQVWPLDRDDGSNGYDDAGNFLIWAGSKNCELRDRHGWWHCHCRGPCTVAHI